MLLPAPRKQIKALILSIVYMLCRIHRITKWLRLEDTSGGHPVQPLPMLSSNPAQGWVQWDGDSTGSLGTLITLTVKAFSLNFSGKWTRLNSHFLLYQKGRTL